MNRTIDLTTLRLKSGGHTAESGDLCIMEATARHLGLPHADRKVDDVCPRIEAYCRGLNDWLLGGVFTEAQEDEFSRRLVTFIPRLPYTKGTPKQDTQRRWMIQETATANFAASAMRAVGLIERADRLSACRITDVADHVHWAAEAAEAVEAAEAAWAAGAAWAARAAEAAQAARAAEAARAAWAAGAKKTHLANAALDLLDRLIHITEKEG